MNTARVSHWPGVLLVTKRLDIGGIERIVVDCGAPIGTSGSGGRG